MDKLGLFPASAPEAEDTQAPPCHRMERGDTKAKTPSNGFDPTATSTSSWKRT